MLSHADAERDDVCSRICILQGCGEIGGHEHVLARRDRQKDHVEACARRDGVRDLDVLYFLGCRQRQRDTTGEAAQDLEVGRR